MSKRIRKPKSFYENEYKIFCKNIFKEFSEFTYKRDQIDQYGIYDYISQTKLSVRCRLFMLHIMFSNLKFKEISKKYKIKTDSFRVTLNVIFNHFKVHSTKELIKLLFKLRTDVKS